MSTVEHSTPAPADVKAGPCPGVRVIPCLNEEQNIEQCVRDAQAALAPAD